MSLHPEPISPVPEETVRVARAAFPKGTACTRMRDELGSSGRTRTSPARRAKQDTRTAPSDLSSRDVLPRPRWGKPRCRSRPSR